MFFPVINLYSKEFQTVSHLTKLNDRVVRLIAIASASKVERDRGWSLGITSQGLLVWFGLLILKTIIIP